MNQLDYTETRGALSFENAVGLFSDQIRQEIAKNMWQLMIPFFFLFVWRYYHIVYFAFIHQFIFLYLYQMYWQIKNYDSLLILLMCRVLAPYGVKRLVFIADDHNFWKVFFFFSPFVALYVQIEHICGIWHFDFIK